MKTIIAGGRDFDNWELLELECDKIEITEVLCGCSYGADFHGRRYAGRRGLDLTIYKALWSLYGRGAGPIRNQEMVDDAEQLIAFWDGKSSGTADVIRRAEKKGLVVKIIKY